MTVPLSEIAEVKLGRQRSPKNHTGDTMRPYLRAANVGWDGLRLDDVMQMNFTDAEMETFRLRPGDLVLNEASGSPGEVGKPALWSGAIEDCAFQNTLLRVRPSAKADPRYLLHYFRYQAVTGAFAQGSRGVGINHLGREALASWPVPLPPLDDQQRIAVILDQADSLRTKRRRSLALLEALGGLVFEQMFGTEALPSRPLGELAETVSGITKGRRLSGQVTRTVPYLAVVNVQAGELNLKSVKTIEATEAEIERYQLKADDLVMTEGGDPDKLGRGALWRGELPLCLHQNHVFRVRVRDEAGVDPRYLAAYIRSRNARSYFLRSAKQTTGIASINMTQLRALPVAVPPVDLQREFASRVETINTQRTAAQRSLASLDELFASLQSRAFSGGFESREVRL